MAVSDRNTSGMNLYGLESEAQVLVQDMGPVEEEAVEEEVEEIETPPAAKLLSINIWELEQPEPARPAAVEVVSAVRSPTRSHISQVGSPSIL